MVNSSVFTQPTFIKIAKINICCVSILPFSVVYNGVDSIKQIFDWMFFFLFWFVYNV